MARRRSAAQEDTTDTNLAIALPRVRHGGDRDPREPLAEGTVETAEEVRSRALAPEQRAADLSTKYARNLIANKGDVVKALAATFNVSEDVALVRMHELHGVARGSSRANTNAGDMMERHDLTFETRVARLRELFFNDNPGVALKAIEMVNEMDASSKAKRLGSTWEDFVTKARAKAAAAVKATDGKRKRA